MGFLSKFEGKMEDTFEGAADKMAGAPLSPVQIAKKAEKQMRRNKMVGAGKQYAPTLYTVLVNADDDERLFGYYPTLAGETETYLSAKAAEEGLIMDGQPLVRFIVDEGLRHGKFDVVAEPVAAPLIAQLRAEEMQRYGIAGAPAAQAGYARGGRAPQQQGRQNPYAQPAPQSAAPYDEYGYDQPYEEQPYDDGYDEGYGYDGNDGYGYDDFGGYDDDQPFNAAPAAQGQPQQQRQPRANTFAPAANAVAQNAAPQATPAYAAPQTMMFPEVAASQQRQASAPARARLIDVTNGQTHPLGSARQLIGRESTCDIVVPDINVSRTHAELRYEQPGVWVLTDLGSTNGTVVNGRQITSQVLQGGETIVMGMTSLQFVLG